MDAGKRARIARIAGFICLGLALINVTVAILGMAADKKTHGYGGNLAIAASLCVVGIVNLTRGQRKPPPDA